MAKQHYKYNLNRIGSTLVAAKLVDGVPIVEVDTDSMIMTTPLNQYQLAKHPKLNYYHAVCNGYKVQVMLKKNGTAVLHTWM